MIDKMLKALQRCIVIGIASVCDADNSLAVKVVVDKTTHVEYLPLEEKCKKNSFTSGADTFY